MSSRLDGPGSTGAVAAASIWLPVALAFLLVGGSQGLALAIAGLFVSPLIGGLLGPQAAASHGIGVGTAVLFAALATGTGAFAYGWLFAAFEGLDWTDSFAIGMGGLLVLGLPIAIVGTKLAIVWVFLVRWLRTRGTS